MIIDLVNVPSELQDRSVSLMSFCAKQLMHGRLVNNLAITLEGRPKLAETDERLGECVWEYEWVKPRDFKISIDTSLRERVYFVALAHEMVHVKQWATGEMEERYRPSRCIKWMSNKVDIKNTEYWDLPWEIEAFGKETGLFIRWCEDQGYTYETHPWVKEIYY